MPLSKDSKPSMRHRRQKYANDMKRRMGKKPATVSFRSARRRVLQQRALQHHQAQQALEGSLRQMGVSWRVLEVAVHKELDGKWSAIDKAFLRKLFKERGVKFAEKEAA